MEPTDRLPGEVWLDQVGRRQDLGGVVLVRAPERHDPILTGGVSPSVRSVAATR